MSKGLRFFGTDFNENQFNGTATASSQVANAIFAFDGLQGTRWISSGENTDGDDVFLEMDYGFNRAINAFFVYNSNIEDIEVQYHDGANWVTANSSIATIVKSTDLYHYFVKLNSEVTTQKVRVAGSDTIVADQEKYVTLFNAFSEIGQFEYFPDFSPNINSKQETFATTDGRGFVIERGEQFSAQINFKSHVNQNDITLAETLIDRKAPFFIWPCGGDESLFTYKFKPFRFQDIFKVAIVGGSSPEYTRNYYKSGYNNKINLIEVV